MNAKETVKGYMDGIVADLFTAEQTYALLKQIGQNANAINQANFGEFFGPLQSVLSNAVFLSVAILFEEPSKKYPTRSISSVLKLLCLQEGIARMARQPRNEYELTLGETAVGISAG
jgi:hypothetical protein